MTPPALEIAGLRKAYDDRIAIDGVDLTVAPGETLGLLGATARARPRCSRSSPGCGVPTRAACTSAASMRSPARGRHAAGWVSHRSSWASSRPSPCATTCACSASSPAAGGVPSTRASARCPTRSTSAACWTVPARYLSGGEQRRVHTGLALMRRSALLLLDEPTAGVDVQTRAGHARGGARARRGRRRRRVLHALPPRGGELGASVAILDTGRVIARGTVDALVGAHAQSMVELTFEGAPPEVGVDARTERAATPCVRLGRIPRSSRPPRSPARDRCAPPAVGRDHPPEPRSRVPLADGAAVVACLAARSCATSCGSCGASPCRWSSWR